MEMELKIESELKMTAVTTVKIKSNNLSCPVCAFLAHMPTFEGRGFSQCCVHSTWDGLEGLTLFPRKMMMALSM
jgi:hypothetical protein